MKTLLLFTLLLATDSLAKDFRLLAGSGFGAPNVNDKANVGNPQVGDIVFDISDDHFYGYGGSSPGWLSLSGGSAPSSTQNEVAVYGGTSSASGTGMGSSSTWVRRFLSTDQNVGSCIVYADSATLGATFTIASGCSGTYAISYSDTSSSSAVLLVTRNSAALASAAISYALCGGSTIVSGGTQTNSCSAWLNAGDVIRAQDANSNVRSAVADRSGVYFRIVKAL